MFFLFLAIICNVLLGFNYQPPNNSWKKGSMDEHNKNKHRISENSLLHYRKWEYSQFGEDGIIEEIFRRIGIEKGFYVEFGAGDGVWISNTYNLFKKGWNGFLIEVDSSYENKLKRNFPKGCGVNFCTEFITWKKEDKRGRFFDEIADQYFPNEEIDFLSIDIDGGDYYIFKSLKRKPKVICIECNRGWHPLFEKEVRESFAIRNKHQPLAVYFREAEKLGYVPVAFNIINLFLVRQDYENLFSEIPKDLLTLWKDSYRVAHKKENVIKNRYIFKKIEDKDYDKILPITKGL